MQNKLGLLAMLEKQNQIGCRTNDGASPQHPIGKGVVTIAKKEADLE